MSRFIKFNPDSDLFLMLISQGYHHEIALLSLMACRARRAECPVTRLATGECYLGDLASMGMAEKQYRTAKKRLHDYGLASFRGSSKGTIGKLLTSDVYDINAIAKGEQRDDQEYDQQDDQGASRGASNKNKKGKNKNNNKTGGEREAHTLPGDFSITREMREWAKSKNLTIDLDSATDRWMNAMEAKGTKYKNWLAAWRNGMILAQQWKDERTANVTPIGSKSSDVENRNVPRNKPFPGLGGNNA